MTKVTPIIDRATQRKLAAQLFNETWRMILKKRRDSNEDEKMVNCAHASLYHWSVAGKPENLAVGEWQVSHVYARVGRVEPSLFYARRCLEICEKNRLKDFYLAYAYEALARAFALAGNRKDMERYLKLARKAGNEIREKDDRNLFFKDLASIG